MFNLIKKKIQIIKRKRRTKLLICCANFRAIVVRLKDESYFENMLITNIKIKEKSNKTVFKIWLDRPGLLIGKMGTLIVQVKIELNNLYKKEVSLELFENKEGLWDIYWNRQTEYFDYL